MGAMPEQIDSPPLHDVPESVVAAHEAGHAVACILFGGTFDDIYLTPEGGAVAQVRGVSRLTPKGWVRTTRAGVIGERLALGKSNPNHGALDNSVMWRKFDKTDGEWREALAFPDAETHEVLVRYEDALRAIIEIITAELAAGSSSIPFARIVQVAWEHQAAHGIELETGQH